TFNRTLVISDFGFEMQDLSDFKISASWHGSTPLLRLGLKPSRGLSAFEQLVFGVYLFDNTLRVGPDEILHNDNVTRLRHGEIGLRRDNHPKCLKVRRHIENSPVVLVQKNFTKINGTAFRRNGPKDVC